MKTKIYILIGCFMLFCLNSCSSVKNEGNIIFPVIKNDSTTVLMVVDMAKPNPAPVVMYQNEFERLEYPSEYKDKIICISRDTNKNTESGYISDNFLNTGRLIMLEKDTRTTLYELSFDMMYPQVINDSYIIFLGYDKDSFFLGKVGLNQQKYEVLINNINNCAPAINNENNILVTQMENSNNYICLYDINGNSIRITQGNTPVWFNNSNRFLFICQDGVCEYDFQKDQTNQIFKGDYNFGMGAVMSPDNKYIAYFKGETLSWPFTTQLEVMSLENGKTFDIEYKGMQKDEGLAWIK